MLCRTQGCIRGLELGLTDQPIEMQEQYLSL